MIRVALIDDSRLARVELREQLSAFDFVEIVGEANNAFDGQELIEKTKVDLVFLDINMPERDGFEMLERLSFSPQIIFTTAFDEYAIQAFDCCALDYLLKPITKERLTAALGKVQNLSEKSKQNMVLEQQFFVKDGEKCFLVKLEDVQHFLSVGNYTRVFFNNEKPLILKSLSQLEKRLPVDIFFRANRASIINLHHVQRMEHAASGCFEIQLENGCQVELSQRKSVEFKSRWTL